jgi:hypothetical protein
LNVLDENIPRDQKELLRAWRIPVSQIGTEIGRRGMTDEEIIPFLLTQSRPTFFTRDTGFYSRSLCHARYGVVCLGIEKDEAAFFIRQFLGHPSFDTRSGRMGHVARLTQTGLWAWRLHDDKECRFTWLD